MDAPDSLMVGWTTLASRADAEKLARAVVQESLAACAQISGPITSTYRWKGTIETTEEFQLTLKFPARHASILESWLLTHHADETPEWIVCEAKFVSEKYLKWALGNRS